MLASILDPSVSKINEALSVTYKLLFILSKLSLYQRSRISVTSLPAPIYIRFDVCNGIYIHVDCGRWQAPWSPLQWNKMKALSFAYKLLFILSKNIVPSQSYRCLKMDVYSDIAHFCDKRASPYIYKV